MVGLEVHASKSITSAEAEKISRYLFHNITKWSPGAATIVYEGDTRALRKELIAKGISKADVDTLVGNPESPLSRRSGTNWGTVPESNLFESPDDIIKNIVSVVRQVEDEGPPTVMIEPVPKP
jgi:hypothetical protein